MVESLRVNLHARSEVIVRRGDGCGHDLTPSLAGEALCAFGEALF
jgi:hypothetical protein